METVARLTLAGYSSVTFALAQRAAFCRGVAAILRQTPSAVVVVAVVDSAVLTTGLRRLAAAAPSVDVDFTVATPPAQAAATTSALAAARDAGTLTRALQNNGLTALTGVSLLTFAQQDTVPVAPAAAAGASVTAAAAGTGGGGVALLLAAAAVARWRCGRRAQRYAYDVFLSYRRTDFAVVDGVCDKLQLEGVHVFIDRAGYMAGRPFGRELLVALHSSAVFTPVITLSAMERLTGIGAADVDVTLVEYVLALHFMATGRLKMLYPLMVGDEKQDSSGKRWDVLWHNARFKALRAALPDVVPAATLAMAAASLRAEYGVELMPCLACASVRDIMCASDEPFSGLLSYDACSLTGLQEDAALYVRHRFAANIKRMLAGQPLAAEARQQRLLHAAGEEEG
jgi:hypothetical protein